VITGATRVAGVIGDPIEHTLSPVLHNAAYEALGIDWVYVPFHARAGEARAALDAMRTFDIAGLSVTMPHKIDVAVACDELTDIAGALQSVNTVTPIGDGQLRGDSTDGEGLMRALAEENVDVDGKSVFLLGAGGAARAVAYSLNQHGAHIVVSARRPDAADALALLVDGIVVGWDAREDAAGASDIIVNATPIGMDPGDESPLHKFGRDQVVADLVYNRPDTALRREARACGTAELGGLGMLVHQAALQIEQWTGLTPPIPAMYGALPRL
jgi:shikimate dehydrogenase